MFKKLKRNFARKTKDISLQSLTKTLPGLVLAGTVALTPAFGQEIIIDGKTNTTLNTHGITTDISTATVKGSNAYNSFIKFNVNTGKVVNLNVPDNCTGLINLVHDEATTINGVLNSIKSGKVDGNIFLVNPHGITVGTQGVVNVGSLTAVTPTIDYMNTFFDNVEMPNEDAVISLLNGKVPINSNAEIINNGSINAIENVKIDTGTFTNAGDIHSDAVFDDDVDLDDIINLNAMENGEYLTENAGTVEIKATNNIINQGKIIADGASSVEGGYISTIASNDVILKEGSIISAKGRGENSNGGEIYIWGNNDSYFYPTAILDTRGGEISGDAGVMELSAKNTVYVGGEFKATATDGETGHIIIDPIYIDSAKYTGAGYVSDALIYTNGANLTISGNDNAQASNMIISTRRIAAGSSGNQFNDPSIGTSGSFSLASEQMLITNTDILTFATDGYASGDIELHSKGDYKVNSFLEVINGSNINAGDGTVKLRADNSYVDCEGSFISIDDSSILANKIELSSKSSSPSSEEIGSAHIYITNSSLKANETSIIATGRYTTPTNPFTNSEAKIIISDTTVEGYENVIIEATGATSFLSDARVQLINVDMKSSYADIDITTGPTVGAMGTFIASDLDFTDGTFDVNVTSANGITLINMDADTSIISGSFAKQLTVNADGSVDRTNSSIGAGVNTNIDVGSVSKQYISLNADSISGSAIFDYYYGNASVDISNNSTKPLIVNDVTTDQLGYLMINGSTYDNYGSFTINKHEDITTKNINITDNSPTTNFYGQIVNVTGSFNYTGNNTNVYDQLAGDVSVITASGISFSGVQMLREPDTTDFALNNLGTNVIDISATSYINLLETDGDLRIGNMSTPEHLSLKSANGNIIQTTTNPLQCGRVYLYAESSGVTLGSEASPFLVNTQDSHIDAIVDGDIFIKEVDGNATLNLESYNGNITVIVDNGSITSSRIFKADHLSLTANGESNSIDTDPIVIQNTNSVDAFADGDINLTLVNDIELGLIESISGDVILYPVGGFDITNGAAGTSIIADNLTIADPSQGNLGTEANPIEIDLRENGVFSAFNLTGNLYIQEHYCPVKLKS